MHSVPVGFGSGSGLFLLWMVCWRLLFGLSGWSGLVWFGCTLVWGRSCYSFCFYLVVCSFRTVCCIQYSFCLVFARF